MICIISIYHLMKLRNGGEPHEYRDEGGPASGSRLRPDPTQIAVDFVVAALERRRARASSVPLIAESG
jgi:hypothetical protein